MSKILYFAYGSNLLMSRIRINNPSAVFKDIGRLEDYRLDFVGWSNLWNGSPATIVETPGYHVWGAIWELDAADIKNLDLQEVGYIAFDVQVVNPIGDNYTCRVYQQKKFPDDHAKLKALPNARRPSLTYLKTIVKGAQDSRLPKYYVDVIKRVRHNGFMDAYSSIGREVGAVDL